MGELSEVCIGQGMRGICIVICRSLLLPASCLLLYIMYRAQQQGLQHQIVGNGWRQLYAELKPSKPNKEPQYGLDFTMEYTINSEETKSRQHKVASVPPNQTLGPECDRSIALDRIETYSSPQPGLFMVESSGKNTLTARQACAVESAVLQSGMQVILVVMATYLDLRDNTTCYLYMKSKKVKIFSLHVQKFAQNSPLESFFK